MYYLAQNNEKTGPFTLEQLREMWRAGAVYPQTLYWEENMTDWQPLERVAASLLIAPGADPLSPVSTSHEPSAYDLPASHLPAAPVPAPIRADALPTIAALPASTPVEASSALIAPVRLPSGGSANAVVPAGPAYPSPDAPLGGPPPMLPGAYLSLIFALAGPPLIFIPVAGWLVGGGLMIASVICGHTARGIIRQSDHRYSGKGVATAGLIIGYLGIVVSLLIIASVCVALIFIIFHISDQPPVHH